jgi:hypothetical protein
MHFRKRNTTSDKNEHKKKKVDESMGIPEGDKLVPSSSLGKGVSDFDSYGFVAFPILVFFPVCLKHGLGDVIIFNGFISTQNKLLIIICTTFIQCRACFWS